MAGRDNNRLLHAARQEVERHRSSTPLNANPVEVLQEVLDSALSDFRYAQAQVDALEADGVFRNTAQGVVEHEWIRLRDRYRQELQQLTNKLIQNGMVERKIRVEEAQAAMMVQAIHAAAVEAGLSKEQVRALGVALRAQVERRQTTPVIESVASDA